MPEFKSTATLADFRTLDEAEVLLGYLEGFDGGPYPGSDRSRSFCHGWRNGRVDAGYTAADEAQLALAAELRALGNRQLH